MINNDDPHNGLPVLYAGTDTKDTRAAMILIHGRGATAKSILALTEEFIHKDSFIFAAPQAANNTWYPYSFLSPRQKNEPGITSGLKVIKKIIKDLQSRGIEQEKIILLGFSQGACLTVEYSARNAEKYGGIIGLTGGLIGDKLEPGSYSGNFENTPIFLGSSDIDPHVPLQRVNETAKILEDLKGNVTKRIYKNMDHTINEDEIQAINSLMEKLR